ncbi:MAG: ATP-binding protein [Lachnospiraceae bacterium]
MMDEKKKLQKIEITVEEMGKLSPDQYQLIDIRGEDAIAYGTIEGSICIPEEGIREHRDEISQEKMVIFCCNRGLVSIDVAEWFRELGYDAYSLKDGYAAYVLEMMRQSENRNRKEEIEKSIRKKFHKSIFSKFAKAINEYDLLQENDKVAVCISGGKDSMLMAKLFQELKRHDKFPFELIFLVMDPGYSRENREIIEQNAKMMDIPITVFETNIFDSVYEIEKSPCYLCARMRRGYLYSKAKELGCNKIALGHHYDDVIETILMGMLYGAQVQTMMPKLHSTNFEGMELIRPMYLVREEDIKHWRDYNGLKFLQCACRFTDNCSSCRTDGTDASKRMEIKKMIAEMKKTNPYVEANIFRSVENVNLKTIIAYKENGVKHHFLESYDDLPEKEE